MFLFVVNLASWVVSARLEFILSHGFFFLPFLKTLFFHSFNLTGFLMDMACLTFSFLLCVIMGKKGSNYKSILF